MSNLEKYQQAFRNALVLDGDVDFESLAYQGSDTWDSVGHMSLVAEIEEAFDIMMEMDDIIDLESYVVGIDILKKYGIVV